MRLFPVTYFGWMGVDLFFVLSGFLIGQQVLKPCLSGQRLSLKEFYLRRAYRILPAYVAVLALYFLVPAWREYPVISPLWKFLTFTMNIGFSFDKRAFSHAWSLCVEEYFYLLLPLLVLLLMRKAAMWKTVTVLVGVVVGGIALRGYLVHRFPDDIWLQIYYPTYTRLDGLVMGVAMAVVRVFRPTWWLRIMQHGHALLAAGVACVAAVVWMFRAQDLGSDSGSAMWGVVVGFPILALGMALVTASSVSVNGWLARIRVPGAETMAALAFTLYLTHKPVAHLMMVSFPTITQPQGPASWMLYGASCLAAAWALHMGVEMPCLRLRDNHLRRKSAAEMERAMRRELAL